MRIFSGPCCLEHGGELSYMCVWIGVESESVLCKSVAIMQMGLRVAKSFVYGAFDRERRTVAIDK